MNQEPQHPYRRARKYLVACLAALVTVTSTSAWAEDSDELKRVQEENAQLRRRLAELEGRVAAQPAATTTTTTTTTTSSGGTTLRPTTDEGIVVLSPYQLTGEKDTGYLRTNSVTATRINMPIQNVPISVSVMSKEFIDDANIRSITDIFRYSSSGSGDNRFAMARPANSSTPQGSFTLRGFGVNSLLRNGVSRYIGYNVNNVDRIEVVKGPASVFFGSGYPGGVVNYITKQPVFAKIPTTVSYQFGENNTNRVVLDHNTQLSQKAAMRIVGSWENSGGERNFEFRKENSLTANITLVPFESGKLRVTGEVETFDSKFNVNNADWIYPTAWFQAYAAPTQALINAAGLSTAADPVAAYRARIINNPATWAADNRVATGNYTQPTYTNVINGAYYLNANGQRIHDKGFNYTDRGSYSNQHVDTTSLTVELSPVSFVDARYVLTDENGRFDNVEGALNANADGRTFNSISSGVNTALNSSGYWRRVQNHQVDLIFKAETWGIKHKLLAGGVFVKQLQQYNSPIVAGALNPFYALTPGATNTIGNANNTLVPTSMQFPGEVPANQVVRDRYGNVKTVQQIYTQWDPGTEVNPDNKRLVAIDRAAIDGYFTEDQAGYLNYNASLLDDRLNLLAGVRREMHRDSGQYLTANFPWFSPPNYAWADQATYQPTLYNFSPSYAGDTNQFQRQAGTSWMAGISYAVVKDVNVFASYSKVFRLNSGNASSASELDVPLWYGVAKAWAQNTSNPNYNAAGTFTYRGTTITSAQQLHDVLGAMGAWSVIPAERGFNEEIGVKTSLWDNKLVGTASLFRAERSNVKLDDTPAQQAEPLNSVYTNGGNTAIFGPTNPPNNYIGARLLRWRQVGLRNRIEGADFEVTWTPVRNFQSVLNGAWMWTAKTLEYPLTPKPGTAAYNALTPAGKVNSDIFYGSRIENVPEYRLNGQNKYTFTDGVAAGLSLGLGFRYSSKTVVSRGVDWNPQAGGFQAGNFLVFDATVGYPWEVLGYKISTQLGVYNLTDEKYFEGTYAASPRRSWLLTNTLKF